MTHLRMDHSKWVTHFQNGSPKSPQIRGFGSVGDQPGLQIHGFGSDGDLSGTIQSISISMRGLQIHDFGSAGDLSGAIYRTSDTVLDLLVI